MDANRKISHLHQTIRQVLDDKILDQKLPLLSQCWRNDQITSYARLLRLEIDDIEIMPLITQKITPKSNIYQSALLLRQNEFYKNLLIISQQHYDLNAHLLTLITRAFKKLNKQAILDFQSFLDPDVNSPQLSKVDFSIFDQEDHVLARKNRIEMDLEEIFSAANSEIYRSELALGQIIELYLAFLQCDLKTRYSGRICWHLLNYMLMSRAYPPVSIGDTEWSEYLEYLDLHLQGKSELLRYFIMIRIQRSLELTAGALQSPFVVSENLPDPKINAFLYSNEQLSGPDLLLNIYVLKQVVPTSIIPLLRMFFHKMQQFRSLFLEHHCILTTNFGGISSNEQVLHPEQISELLLDNLEEGEGVVEMTHKLLAYKKSSEDVTSVVRKLTIYFKKASFKVDIGEGEEVQEFKYADSVSLAKLRAILNPLSDSIMLQLKPNTVE